MGWGRGQPVNIDSALKQLVIIAIGDSCCRKTDITLWVHILTTLCRGVCYGYYLFNIGSTYHYQSIDVFMKIVYTGCMLLWVQRTCHWYIWYVHKYLQCKLV